ncbi:glycosyltransferase family 4 protein [Candidatus Parvarchaeota archaeon]|nr:glycosyltransferase family 4 protein [Candidatus Acidifodinimicrobium mancum]
MKVLMLAWEFPPNIVGGLGRHSYNLVKALNSLGIHVELFLPRGKYTIISGVDYIILPEEIKFSVYSNVQNLSVAYLDLLERVRAYTDAAVRSALTKDFDIIHANDWLTALAGIKIKELTGKKLIVTIHSTEYTRTIGHPWKFIEDIERMAVQKADVVVTVSEYSKNMISRLYNVSPDKIKVIYNAIDQNEYSKHRLNANSKLVLYVGRLSPQKGVDHLIRAFKLVSENDKDAILGIAGEGPELGKLIDLTIDLDLQGRVIFFGRVSEEELHLLYSIASVFVMPSVSEPFGITALEAIASRVPTIISIESGVSEVVNNTFKVNFWDSYQMADIILGILNYNGVGDELSKNASAEIKKLTWENSARQFIDLYKQLLSN